MNYHKQTLLTAIKKLILHQHLSELSIQPRPSIRRNTPFEVYHYEEVGYDYEELQQKMKEQILWKYNEHLYQEECSKLQMELFRLEEAIQIEHNQISYLKIHIDAQKFINKPIPLVRQSRIAETSLFEQPKTHLQEPQMKVEKDKTSMNIYPCVRVEIDPPPKTIPLLPIRHEQKEIHHPRSQRQVRAIYSKRSQTSSQANHNEAHEEKEKTVKQEKKEDSDGLAGLKRQIEFVERAWDNARKQGKYKLGKKYKKDLMDLISTFWRTSAK